MLTLKGELRKVISRDVEVKAKNLKWTEYSLKIEDEKGRDYFVVIPKSLNIESNISFLTSLEKQDFEIEIYYTLNKGFLNFYLASIPEAK